MSLDKKQPKNYRKAWNGGKPPVIKMTGPLHFFVVMSGRGLCGDDEGPFSLNVTGTTCQTCLSALLSLPGPQARSPQEPT